VKTISLDNNNIFYYIFDSKTYYNILIYALKLIKLPENVKKALKVEKKHRKMQNRSFIFEISVS